MRPIQCRYCGTFEPTAEHFANFRCSLRPSEIGWKREDEQNQVEAEVDLEPAQELWAA